jgi:four helix bundle protein
VGFPREELCGLKGQIRRSCSSVPANIAHGCGRDTDADFARFLQISAVSANELEYQLLLAKDLGMLEGSKHAAFDPEVNDVKRMLATLTKKLRSN